MEEQEIKKTTEDLLARLGITAQVKVSVGEDAVAVDLRGDDLGILIGHHGETLASLRHLLGLMLFRQRGEWLPLNLDVDGYRKEREERLLEMAARTADKVRFLQTEVALPPMPAFERRILHMALAKDDSVSTESIGEGWERRVVVKPA
jgi:spoIIIJ-associated protein